jgi:copper chaperone CopZ
MDQMQKISLAIDGMSCGHCVARVTRTLSALPGVRVGTVNLGSATVEYDPATSSPQAIAAALDEAGYPARATA